MTSPDPTANLGYTDLIKYYLKQWGLSSLAPIVTSLGKDSANTSDIIYMKLQDTAEWKQRFAGNEQRVKAGLGVLSPAQYIALESQYKQILSQAGLPAGFYDDKTATDNWIGGDVSPSEVADRAKAVSDLVYNAPPEAQKAWDQFYGGGQGGAIAAILDPKTADPLVQKEAMAAQIGGAALQQGLSADRSTAEGFAAQGVTLQQAQKAYSDIKTRLGTDQSIAGRFGDTFGQAQEEAATLGQNADAITHQNTLYAEEAGQFGGRGGSSANTGNPGQNY